MPVILFGSFTVQFVYVPICSLPTPTPPFYVLCFTFTFTFWLQFCCCVLLRSQFYVYVCCLRSADILFGCLLPHRLHHTARSSSGPVQFFVARVYFYSSPQFYHHVWFLPVRYILHFTYTVHVLPPFLCRSGFCHLLLFYTFYTPPHGCSYRTFCCATRICHTHLYHTVYSLHHVTPHICTTFTPAPVQFCTQFTTTFCVRLSTHGSRSLHTTTFYHVPARDFGRFVVPHFTLHHQHVHVPSRFFAYSSTHTFVLHVPLPPRCSPLRCATTFPRFYAATYGSPATFYTVHVWFPSSFFLRFPVRSTTFAHTFCHAHLVLCYGFCHVHTPHHHTFAAATTSPPRTFAHLVLRFWFAYCMVAGLYTCRFTFIYVLHVCTFVWFVLHLLHFTTHAFYSCIYFEFYIYPVLRWRLVTFTLIYSSFILHLPVTFTFYILDLHFTFAFTVLPAFHLLFSLHLRSFYICLFVCLQFFLQFPFTFTVAHPILFTFCLRSYFTFSLFPYILVWFSSQFTFYVPTPVPGLLHLLPFVLHLLHVLYTTHHRLVPIRVHALVQFYTATFTFAILVPFTFPTFTFCICIYHTHHTRPFCTDVFTRSFSTVLRVPFSHHVLRLPPTAAHTTPARTVVLHTFTFTPFTFGWFTLRYHTRLPRTFWLPYTPFTTFGSGSTTVPVCCCCHRPLHLRCLLPFTFYTILLPVYTTPPLAFFTPFGFATHTFPGSRLRSTQFVYVAHVPILHVYHVPPHFGLQFRSTVRSFPHTRFPTFYVYTTCCAARFDFTPTVYYVCTPPHHVTFFQFRLHLYRCTPVAFCCHLLPRRFTTFSTILLVWFYVPFTFTAFARTILPYTHTTFTRFTTVYSCVPYHTFTFCTFSFIRSTFVFALLRLPPPPPFPPTRLVLRLLRFTFGLHTPRCCLPRYFTFALFTGSVLVLCPRDFAVAHFTAVAGSPPTTFTCTHTRSVPTSSVHLLPTLFAFRLLHLPPVYVPGSPHTAFYHTVPTHGSRHFARS